MKTKKFITVLSLAFGLLVSTFAFTACGSDDDSGSSANPLVGTWRAEVTTKGYVEYWDLTFTKDYKFSYKSTYRDSGETIESETGTYTVKDNIVTINCDGWGTSVFNIKGDELTFSEWDHGKVYKKIN